jgi:2,4-dienoyl-CoA reductase-like NADH-dependent reductase (Old Yellow Enzyme family)
MIAQLAHPGPTETEGAEVIGPSRDFSEVSRQVVVPATEEQLDRIVLEYAAAADRCRRGELDGVEISMAHGLLLASFISPLTNQRDDGYGGDFERRLTLPLRVLEAVREAIGYDLILGIRLGVDDLVEGGLRPADAAKVALAMESRVDYISVMVGNNNRLEARVRHWPPTPAPPGLFREAARVITQAVSKPVAAVGRITTLALANDLIDAGDADMVGMVRAQIADPELIPLSRAGREADVRPCVGINVCTNALLAMRPLDCAVNPDAGHPGEPMPPSNLGGHRSVVVGGGPAGLETARRLAERGSEVILVEALPALGGRVGQWSSAPSRREVRKYVMWQSRRLAALGVDVRLSSRVGVKDVLAMHPDTVVLANGAPAVDSTITSSDGSVQVLTADRAFDGTASGRVVVFDEVGNLDGALIADHLQCGGAEVTLVTSRIHVGEGEGINSLYPMLRTLAGGGVTVIERRRLERIENGQVVIAGVFGESGSALPADFLVTWSGGEPDLTLRAGLTAAGHKPLIVGDALRPRRFVDATSEAKQIADHVWPTQATALAKID